MKLNRSKLIASSVIMFATLMTGCSGYDTGTDTNFSLDFKGQTDAGALLADEYQIIVVAGDGIANSAYDSATADMSGFTGKKLLLLTVNTVNSTTEDASPEVLAAYTDSTQVDQYSSGGVDRYQEDSWRQGRPFITRCRSSRSVCF